MRNPPAPGLRPNPVRAALLWLAGIVLAALAVVLAVQLVRGPGSSGVGAVATTAAGAGGTGSTAQQSAPTTTVVLSGPFTDEAVIAAYRQIVQRRYEAMTSMDLSILEEIYTPDCSCLQIDRNNLNAFRQRGLHLAAEPPVVEGVEIVSTNRTRRQAIVQADVRFGAARWVDAQGATQVTEPDPGLLSFRARLLWDGQRWRQAQVQRLR